MMTPLASAAGSSQTNPETRSRGPSSGTICRHSNRRLQVRTDVQHSEVSNCFTTVQPAVSAVSNVEGPDRTRVKRELRVHCPGSDPSPWRGTRNQGTGRTDTWLTPKGVFPPVVRAPGRRRSDSSHDSPRSRWSGPRAPSSSPGSTRSSWSSVAPPAVSLGTPMAVPCFPCRATSGSVLSALTRFPATDTPNTNNTRN